MDAKKIRAFFGTDDIDSLSVEEIVLEENSITTMQAGMPAVKAYLQMNKEVRWEIIRFK